MPVVRQGGEAMGFGCPDPSESGQPLSYAEPGPLVPGDQCGKALKLHLHPGPHERRVKMVSCSSLRHLADLALTRFLQRAGAGKRTASPSSLVLWLPPLVVVIFLRKDTWASEVNERPTDRVGRPSMP